MTYTKRTRKYDTIRRTGNKYKKEETYEGGKQTDGKMHRKFLIQNGVEKVYRRD